MDEDKMYLMGQVVEQPGAFSSIRVIKIMGRDLINILPASRCHMTVCSRMYLIIAMAQKSGESEFGFSIHGQNSADSAIKEIQESVRVLRDLWPQESRYADSVMKTEADAFICLNPAHSLGSFISSPHLFPSGLAGNVSRVSAPASYWSRDLSQFIDTDFNERIPQGAEISEFLFKMPNFYDGL